MRTPIFPQNPNGRLGLCLSTLGAPVSPWVEICVVDEAVKGTREGERALGKDREQK